MLRPLETLLNAVQRFDSDARFLFVGDYVDRGPDSRQTIDLLLSLSHARFCRGNHDDVVDFLLHGESYTNCVGERPPRMDDAPDALPDPRDRSEQEPNVDNLRDGDRARVFMSFLKYGLGETLLSYGVKKRELAKVARPRVPSPRVSTLTGGVRRFVMV
jgi:Calcineurin-like phosphoesterase